MSEIDELVAKEVAHAIALLEEEPSFDTLNDATATLARAANRLAPPGHRSAHRDAEYQPTQIELERHHHVAEFSK